MNKHILLVMKWLNNKESVSQKELEKNENEAYVTYDTYNAAHAAAYFAAANWVANAGCWVNKYFETTGEDRAQYEKELNK